MTVAELIEKLKEFSPTALVLLEDWSEAYADPQPLGRVLGHPADEVANGYDWWGKPLRWPECIVLDVKHGEGP